MHRTIDAHQAASRVDQRAAGIAQIDGGVGLDEILVAVDLVEQMHAPAFGGDDASRHRLPDVERIADGKHQVAHPQAVAVSERDGGKILRLDLDDGDIGLGVGADDLAFELAVVREGHLELVGAFDDVVVGQDIAVG